MSLDLLNTAEYSKFIHKSRYAKWNDKLKRREEWGETVDRLMDFWTKERPDVFPEIVEEMRKGIFDTSLMPSMRSLMTAGKALTRDNVAGFNCFSSNTKFITWDGIKSFSDFEDGDVIRVLCKDGEFREATIKSFGKQQTQNVTFRPGTRTNVRRTITTTPNHRWYTENRGTVTDLRVGDIVLSNIIDSSLPYDNNRDAFISGFGFGDGTIDSRGRARIRLCGEKDLSYVSTFESYENKSLWYPEYMNGDALIVFHKGHFENWKKLPCDKLNDIDYLRSWLMGYLAADGSMDCRQPVLSSQNMEAIEFVEFIAPLCGFVVTGKNTSSVVETNYGTRKSPLVRITLRKETKFQVTNIEELDIDEVFCVVEPETHSFTLEHGIPTGNCSYVAVDNPRVFDETMYILMCFAPDTLVRTKLGEKKISELTYDDDVLTYCNETGEYEYIKPSNIVETPSSDREKIELEFEDGCVVKCTADHKFLTSNRGWVEAQDLTEDDDIMNYHEA